MKTPRWYIWFTLGYAIYNFIVGGIYFIFPAFRDNTNTNVLYLNFLLACIVLLVSLFCFIMFIYFIFKKYDKHSLWLSGLNVFDVMFTTIGSLFIQIIFKDNVQSGLVFSNLLGAIIPGILLVYSSYLLLRNK